MFETTSPQIRNSYAATILPLTPRRITRDQLHGTGFAAQNLLGPEAVIPPAVALVGLVVGLRKYGKLKARNPKRRKQRAKLKQEEPKGPPPLGAKEGPAVT